MGRKSNDTDSQKGKETVDELSGKDLKETDNKEGDLKKKVNFFGPK